MSGIHCRLMAAILLLAVAVRAESMPPSPAAGGTSAATVSSAPPHAIELLGRWHHGPVYSSAVSGNHVFFGSGGALRVLLMTQV